MGVAGGRGFSSTEGGEESPQTLARTPPKSGRDAGNCVDATRLLGGRPAQRQSGRKMGGGGYGGGEGGGAGRVGKGGKGFVSPTGGPGGTKRASACVCALSVPMQMRPKIRPEMGQGQTKNGRPSVCGCTLGRDLYPFRLKRTRPDPMRSRLRVGVGLRASCARQAQLGSVTSALVHGQQTHPSFGESFAKKNPTFKGKKEQQRTRTAAHQPRSENNLIDGHHHSPQDHSHHMAVPRIVGYCRKHASPAASTIFLTHNSNPSKATRQNLISDLLILIIKRRVVVVQ